MVDIYSLPFTNRAVFKLMSGLEIQGAVVQITGFIKVETPTISRYRLMISDGQFASTSFILANHLTHYIDSSIIKQFAIICLDRIVVYRMQDHRLAVVVSELTLLAQANARIGNPEIIGTLGAPAG